MDGKGVAGPLDVFDHKFQYFGTIRRHKKTEKVKVD